MTNKERLEVLADKVRQAKRFVQNEERVFKGENMEKEAVEFMHLLDETGVEYSVSNFKKMVVLTAKDPIEEMVQNVESDEE